LVSIVKFPVRVIDIWLSNAGRRRIDPPAAAASPGLMA
jgi:hypothetical protein